LNYFKFFVWFHFFLGKKWTWRTITRYYKKSWRIETVYIAITKSNKKRETR
jgi:hypothetical protein